MLIDDCHGRHSACRFGGGGGGLAVSVDISNRCNIGSGIPAVMRHLASRGGIPSSAFGFVRFIFCNSLFGPGIENDDRSCGF